MNFGITFFSFLFLQVKHFDRKREYLKFKERINEGYEPLDEKKNTKS